MIAETQNSGSIATRTSFFPASLPPAPSRWDLLGRALVFAKPHLPMLGVILVLTLISASLGAAEPLLVRNVFDALAEARNLDAALQGLGAIGVAVVVRELCAGASSFLTWRTRLRIHFSLLDSTVERLHRLPLEFHRAEGVGATMTKLDRGIQGFVNAISEISFNLVPAITYLAIGLVIMFQLDWMLALVVAVFVPIPAAIARRAAPTQARREQRLLDRWAKIYSRFNEVLLGLVTVRSFAMEDAEKRRFLDAVASTNREVTRGVAYDTRVTVSQGVVVAIARVAVIGFGAIRVAQGAMSIGTLLAFMGYIAGAFGPVQSLAGIYKTLRSASVALRSVFGILDAQEHLGDAPNAIELEEIEGRVAFRQLRFGYHEGQTPILEHIDFEVAPGERVALVGPSGSGKSTLMALLQRFYDPWEGSVSIDGHDLRDVKQKSVRQQIGVVLQEPVLFNDTVAANIAYGRPDAPFEDIEAAARAAHAHEFISKLPRGYDTVVGERGALLSGGERQRIAIARALLKDPAILILDEATSALDAESESLIQEALERVERGRTSFVVAHRLATVVSADRILVLRHGRVIEQGTHEELLERGGYYALLVSKQQRGMLCEEEDTD